MTVLYNTDCPQQRDAYAEEVSVAKEFKLLGLSSSHTSKVTALLRDHFQTETLDVCPPKSLSSLKVQPSPLEEQKLGVEHMQDEGQCEDSVDLPGKQISASKWHNAPSNALRVVCLSRCCS